jgi:nucleotide-binding universal stress UspA family protein
MQAKYDAKNPAALKQLVGSEASMRAVEKGAALAHELSAEVTLMIAIDQSSLAFIGNGKRPDDDPLLQAARDAAAHWMAAAQALVQKYDVKARQIILEHGRAHQCILQAAQTSGADLIVMGTHGAGLLERLMVGSQTQRVLANTTIPILVIH